MWDLIRTVSSGRSCLTRLFDDEAVKCVLVVAVSIAVIQFIPKFDTAWIEYVIGASTLLLCTYALYFVPSYPIFGRTRENVDREQQHHSEQTEKNENDDEKDNEDWISIFFSSVLPIIFVLVGYIIYYLW